MKKLKTIIVLSFIISLNIGFSQSDSTELSKLHKFVQENLTTILNKIPYSQIEEFGFNNTQEYTKAKANKALYFLIYEDQREIKIWRVPISVDGEYRALLNIADDNGKLVIGDFGANVLAKEIQQTINNYKALNFEGLLRSYQEGSDFMIATDNNGKKVYIPLSSAIKSFAGTGIKLKSIYTEDELKTLLK